MGPLLMPASRPTERFSYPCTCCTACDSPGTHLLKLRASISPFHGLQHTPSLLPPAPSITPSPFPTAASVERWASPAVMFAASEHADSLSLEGLRSRR
jgi:hypothetical protein